MSSNDSLGAYITYNPKLDNTDALRNCISNIRLDGLGYDDAVNEMISIIDEAFKMRVSGVLLKETDKLLGDL